MQVALFMRNRENKQGYVYVPLNGDIWIPSMDEIVSSKTAALGLGWRHLKSQLRQIHAQEFETKARNAQPRPNPHQALGENEPENREIIDLTPRLPEPPTFVPTRRKIKEEEAEVYIKEEEKDEEGQY